MSAASRQSRPPGLHQHLAASLKVQGRRYRKQLKRCQRRFSEEAVHDLRVELRRLLATIELMEAFVPGRPARKARRVFKEHLDVFGPLRDTQVQRLLIKPLAARYAAARLFGDELVRRESWQAKQIRNEVRAFKPGRVSRLIGRFRKAVQRRRAQGREVADLAAALRAAGRAHAEAERMRRWVDAADLATIHRTRIAFKKFRYMLEALAPVLPAITASRLAAMRRYQTMMGDIQDMAVTAASMEEFVRARAEVPISPSVVVFRRALQRRCRGLTAKYLKAAGRLRKFWPLP